MPQRTAIGSCAGSGYVETPYRGNETLTDTWELVVPTTTPRGNNIDMTAGIKEIAMDREFNSYQNQADETKNNGR